MSEFSENYLSAWRRYVAGGHSFEDLNDRDIKALSEDWETKQFIARWQATRTTRAPAPAAAPRPMSPTLSPAHLKERFEKYTKALIEALAPVFQLHKTHIAALEAKVKALEALDLRIKALEERPSLKYLGIWRADAVYDDHDVVTRDGSMWVSRHAENRTTPGADSSWTLAVKHGDAAYVRR